MRHFMTTLLTTLLTGLFAAALLSGCEMPDAGPLPAPEPEPSPTAEPEPEPGEEPADGDPCEVVLDAEGEIELLTEGGNFLCGGDTLLFCRCDNYVDNSCPDQVGTLVAQDLLDDCTCAEWFEGSCPVE